MAVEQALLALVGAADTGAYQINQSLRFDGSSWLARTNSTDTNRKTWTLSYWVKKSAVSSEGAPFSAYENDNNRFVCKFRSGDDFEIEEVGAGAVKERLRTNALHRDASAWYHIVIVYDVTNGTAADRLRIYRNGVRDSALNSTVDTYDWAGVVNGSGTQLNFGRQNFSSPLAYFNGYIAEAYLVDGTALTPSSFGETDTITGAWIPKQYSGSYGTNGFYLKFDPSATNGIGHDHSGNGNNFTATGFSTSGTGTDVMSDTPTTNWCTLNPLNRAANGTMSNGNLEVSDTNATAADVSTGTIGMKSGKYYFEFTRTSVDANSYYGIIRDDKFISGQAVGLSAGQFGYYVDGDGLLSVNGSTTSSWITAFSTNDVCMVAYDADTGKVWFGRNGTWGASGDPAAGTNPAATVDSFSTYGYVPWLRVIGGAGTERVVANFGQRAFAYTPPTGYKALSTGNLPEPTIKKGSKYFDTVLWTGDGADSRALTGLGFQPDMVWIKARNQGYSHQLFDAVRGAGGNSLQPNLTAAEGAEGTGNGYLSAFNSDGFTVATTANDTYVNASSTTYAAWCWDANGAGSSNTAGTITSTVSANATAGFSIVTWTGNGTAGATIGHGLGVKPSFFVVKCRDLTGCNWDVYHSAYGATKYTILNGTNSVGTYSGFFNNTEPTSTLITLGSDREVNQLNATYVAYCFSEVAGYSKFGSYTGNGSSDGPFIATSFAPSWIVVKRTDSADTWNILDNKRGPINPNQNRLYPDLSSAESGDVGARADFLSNGFKLRTTNGDMNGSGGTYIFAAFAEHPFKYANAR